MHLIRVFDHVFPVCRMRAGSRQLEEICGTAFPVGGDAFLTAGHVARAAGSTETCELGVLGEGGRKIEGERVQGVEIFTEVDIALLRLEIPTAQPVPWRSDNLAMLQSVQTAGYPHAVRGGSWNDPAGMLRCAARVASDPSWKQQDPQLPKSIWYETDAQWLGFRLVRPAKIPAVDEMYNYWNSGVESME